VSEWKGPAQAKNARFKQWLQLIRMNEWTPDERINE